MADKYYLAGSFAEDSWKVLPENEMTLHSEDPLEYKIIKELPADSAFKIIGVSDTGTETWYTANSLYTSPTHAAIRRNYYHKFIIPASYQKFIVGRMNPGNTVNDWSSKWNQTSDLTTGAGNIVDVTGWDNSQDHYVNPDYPSQDESGNYIVWVNIGPNWGDGNPRYAVYCFTDGAGSEWFNEVGATSDNVEVLTPDTYTIYFKPTEQHVAMIKKVDTCSVNITTNNGTCTSEGLNDDGTINPGATLTLTFVVSDAETYSLINPTYTLTIGGNARGFNSYDSSTGIATIEDVSGDLILNITFNNKPLDDGWYLMSDINEWTEPVAQAYAGKYDYLTADYKIPDDITNIEFKFIRVQNGVTHWLNLDYVGENDLARCSWEVEYNGNIRFFNPKYPNSYRYIRIECSDILLTFDKWDDPEAYVESWYTIYDCANIITGELYNCTVEVNDLPIAKLPLDTSKDQSAIVTVKSISEEPIDPFITEAPADTLGELVWNEDRTEVAFEVYTTDLTLKGEAGEPVIYANIRTAAIGYEINYDESTGSVEQGDTAVIKFTPCANALNREIYIHVKDETTGQFIEYNYDATTHTIHIENVMNSLLVYLTPAVEAGYYLYDGIGGGSYHIPTSDAKMYTNPQNAQEVMIIRELNGGRDYSVEYIGTKNTTDSDRYVWNQIECDNYDCRPEDLPITWDRFGFNLSVSTPTKIAMYVEPDRQKYYFASNYPINKTALHGCAVSPNVDFVDVDSAQTFTITSTTGSELSNIVCKMDNVEQEVIYSNNNKTATITIPNVRGDIIMSGTTNADRQFILMHPVNNGIMDQDTKLYPYTVDKVVEFDNTGTTIKATNVHDAILELAEREPNPDSPVNPTPTPTSAGTIDFDGVVSGNLNGFNSSVYKFCTDGTTGAGDNEITLKWTQNAARTISLGRLTVRYLDPEDTPTADVFDLTQFKAVGSSQTYTTENGDVYNWSLNATEAANLEVKIANENKTIGEETKKYIKIGTTSVKVTEITLSSRDFGGRTIQSIEIETYGSSKTNAVLTITVGGVDFEFAPDTAAQTINVFGEEWPSYTATGEVALETGETTEYTNVFIRTVDGVLETLEPVSGTLYYNISDKDLYQWRNEILDVISPTLTLGNGADQAYKGSYGQTNYTNIGKLQAMIGSTTEEIEGDEPQTITTIELKGTKIKVGNTVITEEQLIALLALLTN